ncbi:MAG: ribosome biogenesis/translation initiation ATPase RLI [Euryarchaeota archaeon]|nr:ribosome biogenesis/translation initiation ATPase RLI [Euryarchaeota archaeon]
MRVAVLDSDSCQPKKCARECISYCPGVRIGDETVTFDDAKGRPVISEELCTGCGICVKKCPYEAITIVGLPDKLGEGLVHIYGVNGFRLFYLPYPKEGAVTGLVGQNGMGKTTIVRILSGELIPNFGNLVVKDRDLVLQKFAGTQFKDYFKALYDGRVKAVQKPQHVDSLPKAVRGTVRKLLEKVDDRGEMREVSEHLELGHILDRDVSQISGGELQRAAIAACLLREADIYIFDEPSSYLDVRQRLRVAAMIKELATRKRVLVVEHDLIVLDYLADHVSMLYGCVGAYGIVSHPRAVRLGINVYLGGFLKEENIRFRRDAVRFEVKPPSAAWKGEKLLGYSDLRKSLDGFTLEVTGGEIGKGEVVGVLGPNSTGKTTFVRILAGTLKPDRGKVNGKALVSYKPQYIKPEGKATVLEVLRKVEGSQFFQQEVVQPLDLERLIHRDVRDLSGGELQRLAIALCLGREADLYLLDEPSAYLDVEQRLRVARMIRRVMEKKGTTAIVVDHDILFADYISDRLAVFGGEPGVRGEATEPMGMRDGMNLFLRGLGITLRRDPETGRPRVNKPGSQVDEEQKASGEYYYQA